MTARGQALSGATEPAVRPYRKGSVLADWLLTTDHKVIGHLYPITSFGFFMIGGLMAMIMRAQLMGPDNHIVSDQQYNELFTMHGAIMPLLFATPLFIGLGNEVRELAGMGDLVPAPGTTSRPSRGSAPSGRRSTWATPTSRPAGTGCP